jgi:hypothetical protein
MVERSIGGRWPALAGGGARPKRKRFARDESQIAADRQVSERIKKNLLTAHNSGRR